MQQKPHKVLIQDTKCKHRLLRHQHLPPPDHVQPQHFNFIHLSCEVRIHLSKHCVLRDNGDFSETISVLTHLGFCLKQQQGIAKAVFTTSHANETINLLSGRHFFNIATRWHHAGSKKTAYLSKRFGFCMCQSKSRWASTVREI